jgi:hypothetical protein
MFSCTFCAKTGSFLKYFLTQSLYENNGFGLVLFTGIYTMALGSTQPLTEMSARNIYWG